MKKLLLILLFFPMIGLGQEDCGERPTTTYRGNGYYAQNSKEAIEYRKKLAIWEKCIRDGGTATSKPMKKKNNTAKDESVIYKTDTIYFYGYDFSHVIAKTKHPIKDYIFPWIMFVSERNPPTEFEDKMYVDIINDFSYTNSINIKFIENFSNASDKNDGIGRYPLLFDSSEISSQRKGDAVMSEKLIRKFLSEYSLSQNAGVGLVAFIAEINKATRSTLLHFVFFDIKSRDIINVYDSNTRGNGGIGMEKHWRGNFSMSVEKFLKAYNDILYYDYRSEYKLKLKKHKQKRARVLY